MTTPDEWWKNSEYVEQCFNIATGLRAKDFYFADVVLHFQDWILPLMQDCTKDKPETYEPIVIDRFKVKGKTYYLPNSVRVNGEVILQHDGKAKRFIEASNLMRHWAKAKNIEDMPLFLAAYVQDKPGEKYDEAKVIERAGVMQHVTMDVVWDVFFCTSQLTARFESASLRYTEATAAKLQRKLDKALRVGYMQLRGKAFIQAFSKRVKRLFGR